MNRWLIFLFWLFCTYSEAQNFELRKEHDSLYWLNDWRLPYPVYQFQIGDVDGDGSEDAMVGASMNQLSQYLSLDPEKMTEAIQKLGLPLDSIDGGKSEFQEWVAAAREANPDVKLAIKCDSKTPYASIKKLMSELQDMNENRFQLITNLDVKRLND